MFRKSCVFVIGKPQIVRQSPTIDDPHYITCNSLSIVDCDVYELRDFYINDEHVNSLSLDIDTLSTTINNQVLQRPFKNNVKLTAANIINFTSTGWIFKEISFKDEADISESDFPSVTFETNRDVKLALEPGITQIRSITINSLPRNGSDSLRFFFSSGWGKITNQQDLKINTNNLGIHVITASFPIPQVFDHNDDITFEFQPDDDNKFDPPKYDAGTVINNDVLFDFTGLDEEFQVVDAEDLTFNGQVEFGFVENMGILKVKDIIINDNSDVTFSNVEIERSMVLNKELKTRGNFVFSSDSVVTLNWEKGNIPDLIFQEIPTSIPKEINLNFAGELSDNDYLIYNEIFYNTEISVIYGKIPCNELLKRTKLVSEHKLFNNGTSFIELQCKTEGDNQYIIMKGTSLVPLPSNIPNPTLTPLVPYPTLTQKAPYPTLTPLVPYPTLTPLPTNDDSQEDGSGNSKGKALTVGPIIGIVLACVVVVGAIIGIVVYFSTRSKYEALLMKPIETEDDNQISEVE